MLRRLDRYLLREILGPFGLGLLVYTFILLVQQFFDIADWVIKRGIPAATVGQLLLYLLPSLIVLTLPMALLLGVLLGIGRLASDSELIALRSCGVSVYRLVPVVAGLSLAVALVNGYLMVEVKPRTNQAFVQLTAEASTRTLSSQFEPRVFYSEFQGQVLYVFGAPPRGGDWEGVFLATAVPGGDAPNEVIVARRGRLDLVEGGERVHLSLEDAVQHTFELARPDRYETRRYEKLRLVLLDRAGRSQRERTRVKQEVRAMSLGELRTVAADPARPVEQRNVAQVEIQKMFAIPAAALVLGLLALPLAYNNRRGGKSSGFALSIGIVVLYHVLITQGEEAARLGKLQPVVAMWLPNIALGLAGIALLVARNHDRSPIPRALRDGSLLRSFGRGLRTARRAISSTRRAALAARQPGTAGMPAARRFARRHRIVVRLPKLRLRFPNLIDRYVLRRFGFIFGLVLVSALALRVVADFTENVDDILKHQPPTSIVLRYYRYQMLQMAFEVAPLAVLVTTLVTFSLLARTNEVIAARSLGISLYRLAVPAVVAALLVAAGATLLQAQILPASNQKVAEAKDRIKGRPPARSLRSADKQWILGQGRFMYNYLSFDEGRSELRRLQVFEFDANNRLVARLFAEHAAWTPAGWTVSEGWSRTFEGREQLEFRPFDGPAAIDLPESPSYFAAEVRRPAQMTFAELADYVKGLREGGQPQPKYEVALHNKIAFPVGAIVMALVGLPFSFRLQRKGALYGLGISIILGIVFLAVYAFFSTLGEVGALPAAVAVWSPSLLFSLLSGYLFLGVRS
ncbi:MAG: LPS export ABC transporter permease LptF [Thermoanaerobaculia bacterium]|nr:MAG: LPS export ABC transporter permease LptF [Thermoanaerobaculia bacterium]MBZ0101536.1 LPS export ABC transporter permease LptF [Thermoanaerobaculia bacterium]